MCSVAPFCIWGIVSRLGLHWTAWQRFLSLFRRDPNFYSPSPPHPDLVLLSLQKTCRNYSTEMLPGLKKRKKKESGGKKKKKRQPHPKLLEAPGEPVVSALLCHSSQRGPWHVAWSFGLGQRAAAGSALCHGTAESSSHTGGNNTERSSSVLPVTQLPSALPEGHCDMFNVRLSGDSLS